MHPIERLRYVARSHGAPAQVLVPESAAALMAFRHDPAGMVAACRRIVDRQVDCAPLWWLCSRILCGVDVLEEARGAVDEFSDDPTATQLAEALDELGDGPLPTLVEARACGPSAALVDADLLGRGLLDPGRHDGPDAASSGAPVWLIAPVGTVLPGATFDVLRDRWSERAGRDDVAGGLELVDLSAFAAVVRPKGVLPPERATRRADCPVAPELFRRSG